MYSSSGKPLPTVLPTFLPHASLPPSDPSLRSEAAGTERTGRHSIVMSGQHLGGSRHGSKDGTLSQPLNPQGFSADIDYDHIAHVKKIGETDVEVEVRRCDGKAKRGSRGERYFLEMKANRGSRD